MSKRDVHTLNSQQTLNAFIKMIIAQWEHHKWLQVTVNNEKQRSDLQNNSLHLWCQMVADAANENGFDVKSFVNEVTSRAEIPWTGSVVKELIWRPTQIAYTAEQSTTKASTKDYVVICDIINKAMGESMGIHVPWPCKRNKDVA